MPCQPASMAGMMSDLSELPTIRQCSGFKSNLWAMSRKVSVVLSGMLFPVESMPQVLQWLAAVVPPRYYIEAMRKLMIMGVGIGEVAREVAVLAGMTVVLLAIALKKFNVRLK